MKVDRGHRARGLVPEDGREPPRVVRVALREVANEHAQLRVEEIEPAGRAVIEELPGRLVDAGREHLRGANRLRGGREGEAERNGHRPGRERPVGPWGVRRIRRSGE